MSALQGFFIGLSLLFGSLYVSALNLLHIPQTAPLIQVATTTNEIQTAQPVSQASTATTLIGAIVSSDVAIGSYTKDTKHIYYVDINGNSSVVQSADPQTFVIASTTTDYSYYNGSKTNLPSTSESCGTNCFYDAQDKNNKYLQGQIVQPVSQTSVATSVPWISLANSSQFSQKGGQVYVFDSFGNEAVPNADPSTFVSANRYAKDDTHVYYEGETDGSLSIIAGADPATFQVVNGTSYDAQDKNHKYELGGILCEDATHKTCTESTYGASVGIWYQN